MKNNYRIEVKECCASCAHRDVMNDGTRVCRKMQLKVRQKFRCKLWQMSEGLKNAGKWRGVVRSIKTKEIVIK